MINDFGIKMQFDIAPTMDYKLQISAHAVLPPSTVVLQMPVQCNAIQINADIHQCPKAVVSIRTFDVTFGRFSKTFFGERLLACQLEASAARLWSPQQSCIGAIRHPCVNHWN